MFAPKAVWARLTIATSFDDFSKLSVAVFAAAKAFYEGMKGSESTSALAMMRRYLTNLEVIQTALGQVEVLVADEASELSSLTNILTAINVTLDRIALKFDKPSLPISKRPAFGVFDLMMRLLGVAAPVDDPDLVALTAAVRELRETEHLDVSVLSRAPLFGGSDFLGDKDQAKLETLVAPFVEWKPLYKFAQHARGDTVFSNLQSKYQRTQASENFAELVVAEFEESGILFGWLIERRAGHLRSGVLLFSIDNDGHFRSKYCSGSFAVTADEGIFRLEDVEAGAEVALEFVSDGEAWQILSSATDSEELVDGLLDSPADLSGEISHLEIFQSRMVGS